MDVALVNDFSGDCSCDARRNEQLRYADPDMLLNNAAAAKVQKYRELSAAPDRILSFLPVIMSTSGLIHREFLRLLHILSHRQAVKFFETFREAPPREEPTDQQSINSFTFRRAAYFFHNRPTIGLACAQATAMRTHVAPHTIRRPLRVALLPACVPRSPPHSLLSSACLIKPLSPSFSPGSRCVVVIARRTQKGSLNDTMGTEVCT